MTTDVTSPPRTDRATQVRQEERARQWRRHRQIHSVVVIDPEVEEDGELLRQVRRWGVDVTAHTDTLRALLDIGARPPEAVVLSTMAPVGDAVRVTTLLRTEFAMPIVLAVGAGEAESAAAMIAAGARPLLNRPYVADDLLLSLAKITPSHGVLPGAVRVGSLTLDPLSVNAHLDGHHLELTARQFSVLLNLAQHADDVVPQEQLLREVWPGQDVTAGTLATAVARVRRRLTEAGVERAILTHRRLGYRLDPAALDYTR